MRYGLLTAIMVAAFCFSGVAMASNEVAVVVDHASVVCSDPNACSYVVVDPVPMAHKPIAMDKFPNEHPWQFGFGFDFGAPVGMALGFVVHPKTDAISLEAAFTDNVLSPGGRLSIRLDPLALLPRLPVALFADVQGGFAGKGSVPGHSTDLPSVGYQYVNFYGGLRLGRAKNFNWVFEAGPTYLVLNTGNFQSVVPKSNGLTVNNPSATAWLVPTFTTGFQVSW